MLSWSNSTSSAQTGSTTYSTAPAIINGGLNENTCAFFLWCATARDANTTSGGTRGTKLDQATRSSTTPYMVGLSEKIEIQCSNGMPWQWRRICFTVKGQVGIPANTTSFANAVQTSNGWVRVMNQLGGAPGGGAMYDIMFRLFKGQVNSDWVDPMTAQVDTGRVTLKYDKTVTLSSGNDEGFIRKYKRYHPMNKTLVYDDDELGGGTFQGNYSTTAKAGMGDYYVVDMFRARTGSDATDQLSVRPESTLYWHEK